MATVLGANAVSLSPKIELMSGVITTTRLSFCKSHFPLAPFPGW